MRLGRSRDPLPNKSEKWGQRPNAGRRPRPHGRDGGAAAARGQGRLDDVWRTSDIWAWNHAERCSNWCLLSSSRPALAVVVIRCLSLMFVDVWCSPVLSAGFSRCRTTADRACRMWCQGCRVVDQLCGGRDPCARLLRIVPISAGFGGVHVAPDHDEVQNRLANCPSIGREWRSLPRKGGFIVSKTQPDAAVSSERLVYSVGEAADLLGISRAFAYELVCPRRAPRHPPREAAPRAQGGAPRLRGNHARGRDPRVSSRRSWPTTSSPPCGRPRPCHASIHIPGQSAFRNRRSRNLEHCVRGPS